MPIVALVLQKRCLKQKKTFFVSKQGMNDNERLVLNNQLQDSLQKFTEKKNTNSCPHLEA